jgi:hypothetical protein
VGFFFDTKWLCLYIAILNYIVMAIETQNINVKFNIESDTTPVDNLIDSFQTVDRVSATSSRRASANFKKIEKFTVEYDKIRKKLKELQVELFKTQEAFETGKASEEQLKKVTKAVEDQEKALSDHTKELLKVEVGFDKLKKGLKDLEKTSEKTNSKLSRVGNSLLKVIGGGAATALAFFSNEVRKFDPVVDQFKAGISGASASVSGFISGFAEGRREGEDFFGAITSGAQRAEQAFIDARRASLIFSQFENLEREAAVRIAGFNNELLKLSVQGSDPTLLNDQIIENRRKSVEIEKSIIQEQIDLENGRLILIKEINKEQKDGNLFTDNTVSNAVIKARREVKSLNDELEKTIASDPPEGAVQSVQKRLDVEKETLGILEKINDAGSDGRRATLRQISELESNLESLRVRLELTDDQFELFKDNVLGTTPIERAQKSLSDLVKEYNLYITTVVDGNGEITRSGSRDGNAIFADIIEAARTLEKEKSLERIGTATTEIGKLSGIVTEQLRRSRVEFEDNGFVTQETIRALADAQFQLANSQAEIAEENAFGRIAKASTSLSTAQVNFDRAFDLKNQEDVEKYANQIRRLSFELTDAQLDKAIDAATTALKRYPLEVQRSLNAARKEFDETGQVSDDLAETIEKANRKIIQSNNELNKELAVGVLNVYASQLKDLNDQLNNALNDGDFDRAQQLSESIFANRINTRVANEAGEFGIDLQKELEDNLLLENNKVQFAEDRENNIARIEVTARIRRQQLELDLIEDQSSLEAKIRIGAIQELERERAIIEAEGADQRLRREIGYFNQVTGLAQSSANQILQAQVDSYNNQIELQQIREERAARVASDGNSKQLQLEEERLDKLIEKREEAQARQAAINKVAALAEIATNTALTLSNLSLMAAKAGATSVFAAPVLVPTLLAIMSAVIGTVGALYTPPQLWEGTDYSVEQTLGHKAGRDSHLVKVDNKERVLTAQLNNEVKDVSSSDLVRFAKIGMNKEELRSSLVPFNPYVSKIPKGILSMGNKGDVSHVEMVKMRKLLNKSLKVQEQLIDAFASSSMEMNITDKGLEALISRRKRKMKKKNNRLG